VTGPENQKNSSGVKSPFEDGALYDVIFSDFRYDLDFYLMLAKESPGPVLEVACGTGRILIPCMQQGVDIDGIDLYPQMLDRLRQKAEPLGLRPRVYSGDMRDFTLPRRYSLVFIAFNGFLHCLTTSDQLKALRVCREHLKPGGVLAFNTFYPGVEFLTGPQGTPVLELETAVVRVYDTRTFNRVEQVQHSVMEVQELAADGAVAASHVSETDIRWTFKPEMELLLRLAGFSRWEIHGDFEHRPLTRESDLMVVLAWNEG
jgi:SAM-dependent methyltransferase